MAKNDVKKALAKTFVDNHQDVNEDDALDLIYRSEKTIRDLEEEMANHDQLNAAKQIVKDLENGFKSAIKYERAKIAFLVEKVDEIREDEVNPTSGLQSNQDNATV